MSIDTLKQYVVPSPDEVICEKIIRMKIKDFEEKRERYTWFDDMYVAQGVEIQAMRSDDRKRQSVCS